MHHKNQSEQLTLEGSLLLPVLSMNALLYGLCCLGVQKGILLLPMAFMLSAVTVTSQDPSPCMESRTKPETSFFFLTPNMPLFSANTAWFAQLGEQKALVKLNSPAHPVCG